MLRAVAARSPGALRTVGGPQWLPSVAVRFAPRAQRFYADDKKLPDATLLPGSQSTESTSIPLAPKLTTPNTPSSSTIITPENAPKIPHPPPPVQKAPPTPIPPTGPISNVPSPAKPRRRGRFRRTFLLLTTVLGLSYAGGVYYALISDDFHDYFTEYVPGAEQAVQYFEERAFKRRFPDGVGAAAKLYPQTSGENKVTISGRSGASARVSESKSSGSTDGKTDRAVGPPAITDNKPKEAVQAKSKAPPASDNSGPKTTADKPTDKPPAESTVKKPEDAPKKAEVQAPSIKEVPATPIPQIDPTSLANSTDPAVQKVAAMLNGIITVVNADNAAGKYDSALSKARDELTQLASELATYRASEAKAAEEQIKRNDAEFEKAAKEMLGRVQQERKEQEMRWREEYEAESARLSQTYQEKIQAEVDAAQKVADQRLRNELLEQTIKLQDSFAETIRHQVETERGARLSKLNELSTAVSELENLTGKWNEVVDANLRAQHLVVAVDAVRTALESTDRPTPFIHELVALKESSNDNGIVNAAIASINPIAYQRGIPTAAQLIDRFRRVAGEVRKAALLPEDAGVASHAASLFLSKVMFKKQGLAAGDDVESVLTRTETLLEEGDLDEAAREMNGLTGWARVLSQDWLTDCRRVLEVKQAIEVMSTEAKFQSLMLE